MRGPSIDVPLFDGIPRISDQVDNMRGTDFRKTFPEMAYLMDEE